MRWAGHVARIEDRRSAYRVLVDKPERNRQLERPRRSWDDNVLKCNFKKWNWGTDGLTWRRIGTGGGFCKCGNEPSGSVTCDEVLD